MICLANLETEKLGHAVIADMMDSDHAYLAMLLDLEGLQGINAFLPRKVVKKLGWKK